MVEDLVEGTVTAKRSNTAWIGWLVGAILVAGVLIAALFLTYPLWSDFLFHVTGEESLPAQFRGGLEWLGNLTRPQPETADFVPVANAGSNPFGVNTFLEQEVELEKRELAVQMIADAGFHWIRQEFPWEDIEIRQGDFRDHSGTRMPGKNTTTSSTWPNATTSRYRPAGQPACLEPRPGQRVGRLCAARQRG